MFVRKDKQCTVIEPEESYVRNRDARIEIFDEYRIFLTTKGDEAKKFLEWLGNPRCDAKYTHIRTEQPKETVSEMIKIYYTREK